MGKPFDCAQDEFALDKGRNPMSHWVYYEKEVPATKASPSAGSQEAGAIGQLSRACARMDVCGCVCPHVGGGCNRRQLRQNPA